MAVLWAKALWHLLHAGLSCLLFICALFLSCSRRLRSVVKSAPAACTKLPRVVALVVDEDSARNGTDKIAEVLVWLAAVGVQHVALYDMEGILKDSGTMIEERVFSHKLDFQSHDLLHRRAAPNGVKNRYVSQHMKAKSNGYHVNGNVEEMAVELLSIHDGKEAIAEAAQRICEDIRSLSQPQQHYEVQNLSEKDVNKYLQEIGYGRPDPELLLVFGNVNCLQGFPPWRIRLTEIVYLGALKDVRLPLLLSAMRDFSVKTQRYGR